MSTVIRLSAAPVTLARTLAAAILATRTEPTIPAPAAAPALGRPGEVDAAVAAVLVRYAEVMARLADA